MAYMALIYGVLVIFGGYMGFKKAGSKVSLMMGVSFGLLVLISAFALLNGAMWGHLALLILTAMLTAVFLMRLVKTKAFMPSGLMLLLSLLTLIGLFVGR